MSHAEIATGWVREGFARERANTGSVKAAASAIARQFGISPRRALSYWWGNVSHVTADEFQQLERAYARRLQQDRARAAEEVAALDALLARIEGAQDGL
ncbi:hypothetical protein [Roseomonas elaeocarpi]|uniref:Transposase n=1 Tax=Roseomonas elaeocarpi TaxID=907779 RepID=A0ABV6JZ33_9PROT